MVSHPEPDILEGKVKWALGSTVVNKAKGCHQGVSFSMSANLEYPAVASGLKKAPKSLQTMTVAMKLKDTCSLEEKL